MYVLYNAFYFHRDPCSLAAPSAYRIVRDYHIVSMEAIPVAQYISLALFLRYLLQPLLRPPLESWLSPNL